MEKNGAFQSEIEEEKPHNPSEKEAMIKKAACCGGGCKSKEEPQPEEPQDKK